MAPQDLSTHEPVQRDPSENVPRTPLERFLSLFIRLGDPEREKRQLLKQIARDLKRFRIKFYRAKGQQALPALARFFYDIYRIVGPAQALVQHADSSGLLKTIIVESVLDPEQLALKESFSEESIRERLKNVDPKTLAGEIKDRLIAFFAAFDAQRVRQIDAEYALLSVFLDLTHFDYYFLLKKFDSSIQERDFQYNPRFEPINGEYIIEDLKEFLEILYTLDRNADWDGLFDRLKEYRGVDVVSRPAFKKMLHNLKDVQKSGILELIVKHLEEDPYFKVRIRPPREKIVEPYLSKLKTQTEVTLQKIFQEMRNSKIDALLHAVFGTTSVMRLKNYTEKNNTLFSRRMLGGFTHVAALNYLKAFLLDYFKKDIREVVDLLLIRGKWTTNLMSQQLSESFHQLMQISEELIKFDDGLAEDGEIGVKLRKLVSRSEKDQNSVKALRQAVNDINGRAQTMINEAAQNLITIGKNLKVVIEDYRRQPHEILINWKEIELASEEPIGERMTGLYKKIYHFIQLLQMFVKNT
jgi:hypothetical protein